MPPDDTRFLGATEDTPLTCEQLAVAWGLIWVIQYGAQLALPVVMRIDCQAAEHGTFGQSRAPCPVGAHSELSAFVCYLRQIAASRADLAHEHVQAHAGHIANELCDELAKRARRKPQTRSGDLLPSWPGTLFRHPLQGLGVASQGGYV